MIIDEVEIFTCRAGWRDWGFLKISTREGFEGWADCTDAHGSLPGVLATIEGLKGHLLDKDPLQTERIYIDIYRITRQSSMGVVQKALAAIENALYDLKARILNIPVYELLGGLTRKKIPLYWSHFGSTRIRSLKYLDSCEPISSIDDIAKLGREAVKKGYKGIKTNLLIFEKEKQPRVLMQGFKGPGDSIDRKLSNQTLDSIELLVCTLRTAIGKDTNLILDTNMHFRADGNLKLAHRLESYNLSWLEVDVDNPSALKHLRDHTSIPIGSCEKRQCMEGYLPFFQALAMDVAIIDVRWNGIAQSKRIADLAQLFEINVAPHNHGSPLSTLMSAHFCASVTNLHMMEYDVDDVCWRDDLISHMPQIKDGTMEIPDGPGWGVTVNEKLLRSHLK